MPFYLARVLLVFLATISATMLSANGQQIRQKLVVALHPPEDGREILRQSQALIDRLSAELSMNAVAFVATDYSGVVEALRTGRADIGYLGPFAYVLASKIAKVEAFAVVRRGAGAETTYRSLIITNSDSGISSLEELKGKTFAFSEPSSTSGYLFPKAGLLKRGIDPEVFFARIAFSGSHDANALLIKNNRIGAATIADTIFENMIKSGVLNREAIRVLWSSGPIPESPMVWRNDLNENLKKRIRDVLLTTQGGSWSYHGTIQGFSATTDKDYDPVRETAEILKMDLTKLK